MEVLIGILLLFQLFLMIKLLQMNRQTLQQIKVQNEKLIKIEEQRVAMQREEKKESEKEAVPYTVFGQTTVEEKRAKASEQEKLIDEVLSEVFPA